jgi:uncharacterized membrane protein YjjB (DUF3815 family)
VNWAFVLHQTVFGALAAAGFGVLFNVAARRLPWCAASGAVALAVRTSCQELGVGLIGASFAAAFAVGVAAELRWGRSDISRDVLGVVGCIPMVPGSLASKAILAMVALTRTGVEPEIGILFDTMRSSLLFIFTMGAIGTGLAAPMLLLRGARSAEARA